MCDPHTHRVKKTKIQGDLPLVIQFVVGGIVANRTFARSNWSRHADAGAGVGHRAG